MREPLGVGLVHLGEVGHVGEEDLYVMGQHIPQLYSIDSSNEVGLGGGEGKEKTYVHLNSLLNARPSGLQHGSDVLAALLGLLADVALDQVAVDVGGDLARDEDLAVGLDGLRLF